MRRYASGPFLCRKVSTLKEIRRRYAGQNSSEKPTHARRKDKAERECCGAPGRHAVRTGNQLTDSALDSAAARFLFDFACSGAANVTPKRRAQNAGAPDVRHEATQLMGVYSIQSQSHESEAQRL